MHADAVSHHKNSFVFQLQNLFAPQKSGPLRNEIAIRNISLSEIALSVLKQQKGISETTTVFDLPHQNIYRKYWYSFCDTNEIPRITLYELRHTLVSILQALPEGVVKQMVGHSKDMDTFGVYGHAINGEDKVTADRVNSLFMNLLSPQKDKSVV